LWTIIKGNNKARHQWLTSIILVTWEAEIMKITVPEQPKKEVGETSTQRKKVVCGDMHLPS
jgi:hypothetical protein